MKNNFKIHSVQYNFIMNIILKMSQFIFPLITFPYVSRVLLAEANGKVALAASVISYFSLVASLGIPSYGVRKCAEVRDDRKALSKVVSELLIINTVCMVTVYIAFLITILCVPKFRSEVPLYVITSLSVIFNVFGVEWFYQAIEQYNYITVRNILFKIVGIVLMFLLVHDVKDYIIYAGITVFASVGSNILNLSRLHQYVDVRPREWHHLELRPHIRPVLVLFLYNATTTIFTNLDQVMLGFMCGDTSVGYYSATIKIKNILTSVITALGAVMLPRVSYYIKQGRQRDFERLIVKSFEFILISSVAIATFFTMKAEPIILFMSGDTYRPAIVILQFLIPAIVFIGLSSVTAWQLLIPLGMEKYTVYGAVAGALTDLIINILLIPKYDAVGAAIGTTVAELVVLVVHMIALRDIIRRTFEVPELIKSIVSCVIAATGLFVFDRFVTFRERFFDCAVSAVVFFGIYGICLLLLNEQIVKTYWNKGLQWINKKKA